MTRSFLKIVILLINISLSSTLIAQTPPWPTLKQYDKDHLLNIALPIGGIGTGTVSLGGRGELRDWEIMNKPGLKFSTITDGNQAPFFAVYVKPLHKPAMSKALIGPFDPSEYMHYEGRPVNHHGMPRFSSARFEAAYPFGQVYLKDDLLPISVKIKGFNPMIPGDADASSIPIAILKYEVTNNSNLPMEVAVCGTMRNFIGIDGSIQSKNWKGDNVYSGAKNNQNSFRENNFVRGIYMWSDSVPSNDPAWGTIALTTSEKETVSYRRSSRSNDWEKATLDFWDDFSSDGLLTDKKELIDDNPMASLAVKKMIAPHSTKSFTFYITWHFPNRLDWNNAWSFGYKGKIIGNYYTSVYKDAWDVIEKEAGRLPALEAKTNEFVTAFVKSDLPLVVKEAALFNLSTLRSQTVFRLPSGYVMGWEGVMDEAGSCYGSCTHVWNYETATAFLYGNLARSMREVEMDYGSKENGKMMNRVNLPLEENFNIDHVAAADGQMGSIMRFYREWKLSGDNNWLKKYWPKVKAAMSYAWIKGGWDANEDGVEEGRQHNTMDVDYFGPNPQMQFWYFGALKASSEMAKAMNDLSFSEKCDHIFALGSKWVDENLFNGAYYEHKITDPNTYQFLDMKNPTTKIPDFQLGAGCLVDQLVGQYMAHVCGLGYLGNKAHIQTALKTVMKNNFIGRFDNVFNNMRSYVMDKESGLIMASWPKGRLRVPFPYFAESMSGFEYAAAIGMLYEGQIDAGLKCIQSIRDRFDGQKRNPFDEPECGHHYARAMASWSATLALTGFQYSGIDKTMRFDAKPGNYFWSNGYSWGTIDLKKKNDQAIVLLKVLFGDIELSSLTIKGYKTFVPKLSAIIKSGDSLSVTLQK
ncbi:MAG: GH116 family glycosyl-hydrolase [Chitinophagaceae bacterium]